jgi:glucose-1-phosphate cytidylyltransferase
MKVAVLCGGQGIRLREETELKPKPMVEIGGRTAAWYRDFFA